MKTIINPYIFFFGSKEIHDDDIVNMFVDHLEHQPHYLYSPVDGDLPLLLRINIDAILATEYVIFDPKTSKIRMFYDKKGNTKYKDEV